MKKRLQAINLKLSAVHTSERDITKLSRTRDTRDTREAKESIESIESIDSLDNNNIVEIKKELLEKFDTIEKNEVPKIFAMTIGHLEERLYNRQNQLLSSATHDQRKKYSKEIHVLNQAIGGFADVEKKYFKEGKIDESERDEATEKMREIMKANTEKRNFYTIDTVKTILESIQHFPKEYERDVRYVGDNKRLIMTTQSKQEGSPKYCKVRCVKWNSQTKALETIFDPSYVDTIRKKASDDYDAPDGPGNVHIREIHEGKAWSKDLSFAGCVIDGRAGNLAGTLGKMEEFWVCEKGNLTVSLRHPDTGEKKSLKVGPGDHFSVPPRYHYQVFNHSAKPASILLANVPGWSGPKDWKGVKSPLLDDTTGQPISGMR